MAEGRNETDDSAAEPDMGRSMKRRGILAAAGAVVAGIVAKQAGQPVAAAPTTMMTETANMETATTSIVANPGTYAAGGAFVVDASGSIGTINGITVKAGNYQQGGIGIEAHGGIQNAGVLAYGGGTLSSAYSPGPGVIGLAGRTTSPTGNVYNCGVYGEATNVNSSTYGVGVHGKAKGLFPSDTRPATGVFGEADAPQGVGVQGQSQGIGVYGLSLGSYGVVGVTTAGADL